MTELKKPDEGILLGINPKNMDFITYDSPGSVLVVGPTRSGKGVNTIIPTGLSWQDSAFFLDYKGETWHLTSGYRKEVLKQTVIKFDPFSDDGSTSRWNPLAEVRFGTDFEMKDANCVATILVSDDVINGNSYLMDGARMFLSAAIVYLGHKHDRDGRTIPCMSDVAEFILHSTGGMDEGLTLIEGMPGLPDEALSNAHTVKGMAQRIKEKVLEFIREKIELFEDSWIRFNTKTSDFSLDDILNPSEKVSCYFVIPVRYTMAIKPLSRLFVGLLMARLAYKGPCKAEDYAERGKLLLMLDEFICLGYLRDLQPAIGACTRLGIQMCLVCQDVDQLEEVYGKDHIFFREFVTQLYFNAVGSDKSKAEALAERCNAWVKEDSDRAIITPIEVLHQRQDQVIVLIPKRKPFVVERLRYYLEPYFNERVKDSPACSDRLKSGSI